MSIYDKCIELNNNTIFDVSFHWYPSDNELTLFLDNKGYICYATNNPLNTHNLLDKLIASI